MIFLCLTVKINMAHIPKTCFSFALIVTGREHNNSAVGSSRTDDQGLEGAQRVALRPGSLGRCVAGV